MSGFVLVEDDEIKCPVCGKDVYSDIWEEYETGEPTEDGFYVWCNDPTFMKPCILSYDQGLDLRKAVYQWLLKKEY